MGILDKSPAFPVYIPLPLGGATRGGAFRSSAWDPLLIVGQIVAVQSVYYLTLGVWLVALDLLVGTSRSLDHVFKYQEIQLRDVTGKLVVVSFVLNSLTGSVGLWCLVQRTKLCLDFTCTAHFLHLALCWIYNGYLPDTFSWWSLNTVCLTVMCVCAEFLCMRTEMRAIPLSNPPRVHL